MFHRGASGGKRRWQRAQRLARDARQPESRGPGL